MIRRPPRSTPKPSSAASDVYKRQIYANFISGVFIYDFMDYRKRGAPLIYLALLSLQTLFFFVVMALDRIADWNLVLAALIVSVMTWQISKIKDPSQG